jgi:hypothetical protein
MHIIHEFSLEDLKEKLLDMAYGGDDWYWRKIVDKISIETTKDSVILKFKED